MQSTDTAAESTKGLIELRVFLLRHGLRQEDLADRAGISRVALGNIIAGESQPKKDTIDAILEAARTFDPAITYEALFGAREAAA
jgi:transcriptional regulator with XRE-family HTH domain